MVETNAELGGKSFGFSGKLKKENSFVNHGEAFSDSRSDTAQGRKQKRHDSGFSFEHGLSTPASTGRKQVCFHSACIVFMSLFGRFENMHVVRIVSVEIDWLE